MNVVVCAITYRRSEGLARMLLAMADQVTPEHGPNVRCIIVDNDEHGSASAVCDAIRPSFPWELACYPEPRRGIPQARNRAVACAGDSADFIVFIDDDEVPDANWLATLLRVQREYDADVVAGPVIPRFDEPVPPWVEAGRFLAPRRRATGAAVDYAYTGNVLFRADILRGLDPVFDERLRLTGGSDAHLAARLHKAGHRFVWADEAIVHERVPASRVTARWILQRVFRNAYAKSLILRDLEPSWPTSLRLFKNAVYRLGKGLLLMLPAVTRGKAAIVATLGHFYYAAGMLVGLTGLPYNEYKRTHGR